MDRKKVSEKAISDLLFMFLLFVFTLAIIPWEIRKVSFGIMASFIANGMLSYIMIVNSIRNKAYSLEAMHWVFYYFFFFFAALIQYMKMSFLWGLYPTDEEIINTNMLIFLWGICFTVGSMFSSSPKKTVKYNSDWDSGVIIVFSFIAIVLSLYMIKTTGLTNLLSRATNDTSFSDNGSTNLLITYICRAFVTFNAVICILNYKKNRTMIICLVIALICLLVCCFPLGMSRFDAAAIYLGMFIILFNKLSKGKKYSYIFVTAFVVIFPLLNSFRSGAFGEVDISKAFKDVFVNMQSGYTEGHYDAYSMFVYTQRYISYRGIAWGKQFLGNLLFFVPRAFWPDKPVGSGYTIMDSLGRLFKNVSEPLPAEFYFNFGTAGVLFGGIIVGNVIKKIDSAYWNGRTEKKYRHIDLLYPFAISLFFFMMRGDFLSTLSFFSAYIVISYYMYKFCARIK